MKRIEIADRVAAETGISKAKAEEIVSAILDEVKQALSEGEPVTIRRFGTFQVRDKNARLGRNPKTGEEAEIPERRVVRFKPGNPLRNAVNGEEPGRNRRGSRRP